MTNTINYTCSVYAVCITFAVCYILSDILSYAGRNTVDARRLATIDSCINSDLAWVRYDGCVRIKQ